jgi:hypothetical protein
MGHKIAKVLMRLGTMSFIIFLAACPTMTSFPIVTSRIDPIPFQTPQLKFIEPGKTDADSLVKVLGDPTFVRKGGRMLVYASAVNVHRFEFVGEVSTFDHYYLFIDLAENNTVASYEVVTNAVEGIGSGKRRPCRSSGICVDNDPWIYRPSFSYWGLGHEILPENWDIAVLTDTSDAESFSKTYLPGLQECAIYIWDTTGGYPPGVGNYIQGPGVSIDNGAWRALLPNRYIWRRLSVGRHQIKPAVYSYFTLIKYDTPELSIDCQPAATLYAVISIESDGFLQRQVKIEYQPEETSRSMLERSHVILE